MRIISDRIRTWRHELIAGYTMMFEMYHLLCQQRFQVLWWFSVSSQIRAMLSPYSYLKKAWGWLPMTTYLWLTQWWSRVWRSLLAIVITSSSKMAPLTTTLKRRRHDWRRTWKTSSRRKSCPQAHQSEILVSTFCEAFVSGRSRNTITTPRHLWGQDHWGNGLSAQDQGDQRLLAVLLPTRAYLGGGRRLHRLELVVEKPTNTCTKNSGHYIFFRISCDFL